MTTTIKVTRALRDRLRDEADRDRLTLGQLLEDLLTDRARARRFEEMRHAFSATDQEAWASWREETDAWGSVDPPEPDA